MKNNIEGTCKQVRVHRGQEKVAQLSSGEARDNQRNRRVKQKS